MRFPVDQPYQITTKFNAQTHPGIDIAPLPAGQTGRQCFAPEASSVYASGFVAALEGNYIILKGNSGVYYYFGHFESRLVTAGQLVREGQAIGIIGQTGAATGVHTHHEVRPKGPGPGASIDPEQYYKNNQGGNDMFPNEGDLKNFYDRTGWPGHVPNKDDIAYWTTGTNNDGWAAGADNVWKDLIYSVTLFVLNKPNYVKALDKQTVVDYLNKNLN